MHHTHATAPNTTLACIAEKRHLHNQTHGLRRRKHDTGGKHAAGRHNPRGKGRSESAQDGAGMCTTPMPQLLTQPSHALPKNAICPTKLTGCDEGRMTQEGNTPRGDITQERKEGQQVHKMGQVCAPHPCHNPSHNPPMHCRKTPFAQPNSHAATKKKHDTGGKRVVGDITKERKVGQQVHKMGQGLCTTPMPQPLTQPSHALPKNAICPTKLTGCDEGSMTREESVLWET